MKSFPTRVPPHPPRTDRVSGGGHERRPLGIYLAGALLLAELLLMAGRFTTATLPDSSEGWVPLMSKVNALPQIGLAVVTALLLFGTRRPAGGRSPTRVERRSPAEVGSVLVAQLASFALLHRSTADIFERHLSDSASPALSIATWMALGLATVCFGALLFLPLRSLTLWLHERAGTMLGAGLLGVFAWWAGRLVASELRLPLRAPTLWISQQVLGLFSSEVFVDASDFVFGTDRFRVRVAPQCSGFEGIGLMLVFASAYLWIFRRTLLFPRALLLLLLGVLGVWIMNAFRLVGLVVLGTYTSARIAEGFFHSLAGTLAFCAAALGLVGASRKMRFFASRDVELSTAVQEDATAAYLLPFLLMVAGGMVASAFEAGSVVLQPLRTIVAGCALLLFRKQYPLSIRRGLAPAITAGVILFFVWIALPDPGSDHGATVRSEMQALHAPWFWSGIWIPIRILGCVLVHPLAEELAFRGYLLRRLTAADFEHVSTHRISIPAWVVSTLLFGVLHGNWTAATIAGAVFGFVYIRRGELADAVVAHACTNALLVALALVSGDWSIV